MDYFTRLRMRSNYYQLKRTLTALKMTKRFFLYLLIFMISSISCATFNKPEFKKIQSVKLRSVKNGKAELNGEVVFFNPNKKRIKLKSSYIEVFIKDKKVADIEQDWKVTILSKRDFVIPFKAFVPLSSDNGGILSQVLSILKGKEENVLFKGHLLITVNHLPYKVDIEHEEIIKYKIF